MVVGPRSAQLINHREKKRYAFLDAIGGSADFICRALHGSFGARTVVAHHENDERIVHLARLLHRVEQTANVIISVRQSARIDLHHPCEQALLVRRQRIPRRNLFRARRQLGIGRTTSSLICRASVSSRTLSQPWSNCPLYFAIQSLGT